MDIERVITHACREFKMTKRQMAEIFGIPSDMLDHSHIAHLWRMKIRKRK